MITLRHPISFAEEAAAPPTPGVLLSEKPDLFERINDPAVELLIWRRSLPSDLALWLIDLPAERLPKGRLLVREKDLPAALMDLIAQSPLPEGRLRSAFLEDLQMLARLFLRTMAAETLDLRLDAVSHDACWKFHRDSLDARLLTTYRGPGTEWVPPCHSADALAQQRAYLGPLLGLPRHGVGLFKGSQAGQARGIVHRSPPIAETGTTRLLLCLNLPSAGSPPLWQAA